MPTAFVDVIGTLFSVEPVRQRLAAIGAPEHALELWLAEGQRDAMALSLAGRPAPLLDALAAALPRTLSTLGKGSQDPSRHELVMKGFQVLNPVEGAKEALEHLARAGFRCVAVTHGTEEHARALLDRAGILARFAAVAGAGAGWARAREDVDGWFLTSHAWDAMSAQSAGLRAAWISRREKRWPASFPPPALEAPDLLGCAKALAADGPALLHAAG